MRLNIQVAITIPTSSDILRHWKWGVIAALALAFSLSGPRPAAGAGNSITSPDTTDNVGQYTSVALDADGNPVVSYYNATNNNLKVLRCGDAVCATKNTKYTVDFTSNVGKYTSLALDAAGRPVVSYFDDGNNNLKLVHCGDASCSAGNSIVPVDTNGSVGRDTSLALDADGKPVVSYYDVGNGNLKLVHCGNAFCTSGNEISTPASSNNVGQYTSLALDGSGNPVVSYYDDTNADLRVLHCGDPNCSSGNIDVPVDTTNNVGQYTSLALDSSGKPVVSYYDVTNHDLKLVHCGDANCSTGNSIIPVDSTGDVGQYTSLDLDMGNPVVSYYDVTNGDLKLLHCGNPSCTSGNTIEVPDTDATSKNVGKHTSLVVAASSRAVVSYFDETNNDLKVVHCGDASCLANPPTPTATATSTFTPTPAPPQLNITKLSQIAPPKSCYNVLTSSQTQLFQVCDNDWLGTPASNAICVPDGVCNDEDPAQGQIKVTISPGDYHVVESVAPPNHSIDTSKHDCDASSGTCAVTVIDTPNIRPWFPWDIVGIAGPCGGVDGHVTVADILAVVQHYGNYKPATPNAATPTPGPVC